MKKKIIIDLDVVTIGVWKKADPRKEESLKFMTRVKAKEFEVIMLSSTLNLLDKWKYTELSKVIRDFYVENTDLFLDEIEIFEFLNKQKINSAVIIDTLLKKGIKREDILLILACVTTNADYLVTLNRRHLKNNADLINSVLTYYKLRRIKVVHPNEI